MKNIKHISIKELRPVIKGNIITPGDPEYNKIRTVFYGGLDKKPAMIIQATDAEDVAKAVLFARTAGMELAVRSGGHSFAGHSVSEGGMVIDLRNMKKIEINAEEKTLWAETGLTAGEVINTVDKYNLAIGFGDTGSVGIGGITLSGGVGFLARKHGLTIDNLLAAEIITADGKLLQVDAETYPDLFWAIRGGGGNFGVVTKFKYKLNFLSEVYGGMLLLPASPEVISGLISYAEKAPDELTAIINVMPAPPMPFVNAKFHGKLSVLALIMYAGDPVRGERLVAPLRALAEPMADMLRPMRYKDMFLPEEDYHPKVAGKNMFMKHVDLTAAETIIRGLEDSDASMRVVQLRVLGGAVAQVPAEDTAFAHRQSTIMCNIAAFYESENDKQKRQMWVDNMADALYQGDDGVYVGFLGAEGDDRIRKAYPEPIYSRLNEIKNLYDPANLFSLNQNIPPLKKGG